ncbi:MAG: hypothetical protein DMF48_07995 [Verrucomicrobia bacterium]|nr:MAG: hypothetical protein DMF48_07995 [Verrucomicrobiota bacterium]
MRSVRGKLCAAFSFGPGSARGSRVGGRALSIANFSGVQIHFAALLTTCRRGRAEIVHASRLRSPQRELLRLAILVIHSVANLVIISAGKRIPVNVRRFHRAEDDHKYRSNEHETAAP